MKQRIITIGLFLLFSASSHAQIQFPNKDGEWYILMRTPESDDYSKVPAKIEKDTLINSLRYLVMNGTGRIALRTDYPKTFYINLEDNVLKENLLYDFSIEKGDSVELIHNILGFTKDTAIWTCSEVEYQTINNSKHKVIWLNSAASLINIPNCWIEGIGSIWGPVYTVLSPYFEISYELYCYKENKESKWGACNMLNAKQYSSTRKNHFYDQASSCLMINNEQEKYDLSVYNYMGKLIFSTDQCTDESIDLSWLEKGIYIYNLQIEEKAYSNKFEIN